MKLKTRVLIILTFCVGGLIANVFFVRHISQQHSDQLTQIKFNLIPASMAILEVEHKLEKQFDGYENALIFDDVNFLKSSHQQHIEALQLVKDSKTLLLKQDDLYQELSELERHLSKVLLGSCQLYEDYIKSDQNEKLAQKIKNKGMAFQILLSDLQAFRSLTQEALKKELGRVNREFEDQHDLLSLFNFVIILISLALASALYRTVVIRISSLEKRASTLSTDLESPVPEISRDEIGALAKSMDLMRKSILTQKDELVHRTEIAEQAVKVKSSFLANMSHELRTPIHAILGMTEVLKEMVTEDRSKRCLETVGRAGKSLLELINDILDYSKLEAGKTQLKKEVFLLNALISDLGIMFQSLAQSHGNRLVVDVDQDTPHLLNHDSRLLRQILTNLMSNAIKFTQEGSVTLKVTVDSPQQICFKVIDTGIGMGEDDLDKIFEQFHQVENSYTKTIKGTGLGLSICRSLAQLMGATLSVESELGAGSTFSLLLPHEGVIEDKQPEETKFRIGSQVGNILAAEDNEDNQELLKLYIKKLPFQLTLAENGKECFEKYKENPTAYSMILMDMQMPVMDGFESVELMRAFEKEYDLSPKPIVALTALSDADDLERCRTVGCNDVFNKPISKSDFRSLVLDHAIDLGDALL